MNKHKHFLKQYCPDFDSSARHHCLAGRKFSGIAAEIGAGIAAGITSGIAAAGRLLPMILALIILILSVLLPGCAARQEEPQHQYMKVGMVLYNINDTFLRELTEDFREEMQAYQTQDRSISITVKDGGLLQRVEDEQLEELIDAGSDILCVNLVDRTAPSHIIDLAKEKNIPVIFFNREPVKEDLQQWDQLYYVGSDARESGVLQGQMAADYIRTHEEVDRNKDGKIQFVLLEGEPDHQDTIIRTESSVSTMTGEGIALEKLSYQVANWNRAQAQTKMSQMITRFGSSIEMVLANNDEMAIGVEEAYDQANITESDRPVVFGIDGTKEGLQALADGRIQGTVYHDRKGQAQAMAQLCITLYEKQLAGQSGSVDLTQLDLRTSTQNSRAASSTTPDGSQEQGASTGKEDQQSEDAGQNEESDAGTAETRAAETKTSDTRTTETGTVEIGTAETGVAETGTAETGTSETREAETGTAETRTAETGTAETGTSETGASQTRASQTRTAVEQSTSPVTPPATIDGRTIYLSYVAVTSDNLEEFLDAQ